MAEQTIGTARVDIVVNTNDMQAGIEAAKRQMKGFSDASSQAQKELDQMTSAQRRQVEALQRQINTMGLTKQQLAAFNVETKTSGAVQDYLRKQLEASGAAAQSAASKFNQYGLTAKQVNASLRGVPAQLTDIIVSLQGGQAPLTVLLQQGGQLRDMFGGIKPAATALAGAALNLIKPWTLAAAALVGVGVAAAGAESKMRELLQLSTQYKVTGRDFGMPEIDALIENVNKLPGVNRDAATQVVAAFAGVRQIGPDILTPLTGLVADFAAATGTDAVSAAKALADAFKDPVAGAKTLDEQFNILTADQQLQIQTLAQHGDALGAQRVLYDALADRIKGAADNQTELQKATDGASNAWDRFKGSLADTSVWSGVTSGLASILRGLTHIIEVAPQAAKSLAVVDGAAIDPSMFGSSPKSANASSRYNFGNTQGAGRGNYGMADLASRSLNASFQAAQDNVKRVLAQTAALSEQNTVVNKLKATVQDLQKAYKDALATGNTESAKEISGRIANAQKQLADAEKREAKKNAGPKPKAYTEDAATRMLDQLRQTGASYQAQLLDTDGKQLDSEKKLAEFNQQIADIKSKKILTADQKSLLARQDAIRAELENNVALQRQVQTKTEQQKLDEAALKAMDQFKSKTDGLLAAADEYNKSQREGYTRNLIGFGLGDQAQSELGAQATIYEHYSKELQKYAKDAEDARSKATAAHPFDEDAYEKGRASLVAQLDAALQDQRNYYDSVHQLQSSWEVGAAKAYGNYLESASNVASQTQKLFDDAFSGMEDALVDFATTGKASFSDFAESVIKDLIRIQLRAAMAGTMSSLSGGSGLLGAVGDLTGTSIGGTYGSSTQAGLDALISTFNAKGNVYASPSLGEHANTVLTRPTLFAFAKGGALGVAGEAGPEAIMPLTRTSSGRLGVQASGSGMNVQINNYGDNQVQTRETSQQMPDGSVLKKLVVDIIKSDIASGGQTARQLKARYGLREAI